MLSQNPRISHVPQCARCLRAPDDSVHRSVDGHAFALTTGEAISGRLDEAHARSVAGELEQRREARSRALAAEDARNAERILERYAPGLIAGARAGVAALAAEQLERGGHAPFEGPRLHEVLSEFFYTDDEEQEEELKKGQRFPHLMGLLRLAIADALRERFGSSPALEDFVLSPEVSR